MTLEVLLAVSGGLMLALGPFSTSLKRMWLSGPLLALLTGIVLGPHVLGVLEIDHRLLEELARVTLAVALVGAGLQLRSRDLRPIARPAALLLTLGMLGMWAVSGLGAWLLLDVPFWVAMLIGAIVTPTDPVIASAIVTGRLAEANLPRTLRRTLQMESGANDGLAVLFVLLSLLVLQGSVGEWPLEAAKQVLIAIAVGVAIGWPLGKLVDVLQPHAATEKDELLVLGVALAAVALGVTHLLGGSGVLAAFVAGLSFSLILEKRLADRLEAAQDGIERILILPVFALFGAALPWGAWAALGLPVVAFALWALLLRRPVGAAPALALAPLAGRDRLFLGWFGPIGVAALFYVLFAEQYGLAQYETVYAACSLAIVASVVAHSLTATPGLRRHAGRSPMTTLRHPFTKGIDDAP